MNQQLVVKSAIQSSKHATVLMAIGYPYYVLKIQHFPVKLTHLDRESNHRDRKIDTQK